MSVSAFIFLNSSDVLTPISRANSSLAEVGVLKVVHHNLESLAHKCVVKLVGFFGVGLFNRFADL